MSGTKKVIILLVIAFVITMGILTFTMFIPKLKRKKLSEAIADQSKKIGNPMTADDVKKLLEPATNKEIDILIDFAKKLQANNITGALAMSLEVTPILQKTHLQDAIFG